MVYNYSEICNFYLEIHYNQIILLWWRAWICLRYHQCSSSHRPALLSGTKLSNYSKQHLIFLTGKCILRLFSEAISLTLTDALFTFKDMQLVFGYMQLILAAKVYSHCLIVYTYVCIDTVYECAVCAKWDAWRSIYKTETIQVFRGEQLPSLCSHTAQGAPTHYINHSKAITSRDSRADIIFTLNVCVCV